MTPAVLSFFLFGLAHGLTLFPLLAAGTFLLVVALNLRPGPLVGKLNHRAILVATAVVAYLCLNEILHGHPEHLVDLRFYRSQGKSLYMLSVFAALYLMPVERLRRGLPAACAGFAVGAAAIQVGAYVIGFKSPLLADLAIRVAGGHNVISGLIAQTAVVAFVAARMASARSARLALWTLFVIALAFFVLGVSRANSLGLLAALSLAYFLTARRQPSAEAQFFRVVAPYVVLIGVVGALALGYQAERWSNWGHDRNVQSRVALWERALDLARDGLLFGTGLGGFDWRGGIVGSPGIPFVIASTHGGEAPWASSATLSSAGVGHTHNLYLQVLTESGLLGLLFWIAFFAFIARKAAACLREAPFDGVPDRRGYAVIALSLLAFALVAGVANAFTLMAPSTAFLLYVIAAYLAQAPEDRALPQATRGPALPGRTLPTPA